MDPADWKTYGSAMVTAVNAVHEQLGTNPVFRLIGRADGPDQAPIVLLGAGASAPHLPVADALKQAILDQVAVASGEVPDDIADLRARVAQPHITLEVFCSMLRYRCGERFQPIELWSSLCAGIPVNPLSTAIAQLRQAGLIGPILTTNFDPMLPDALEALGAEHGRHFRVLTDSQLTVDGDAHDPLDEDICALHGTIYRLAEGDLAPPLTATARGLARPFSPGVNRYLVQLLGSGRPVLVLGYSGQDHYDVNPLLQDLRRSHPGALRRWLWVSHNGEPSELRRVARLFDQDQVLVEDATQVLLLLCRHLGLSDTDNPASTRQVDPWAWRRNLDRTIRQFALPVEGARNFVQDLRVNLPGAWVVLEHYRLFSAGYDESATLTFGGVHEPESGEGETDASHLAYLPGPWEVPFGQLLDGQFSYWSEGRRYQQESVPNSEDQLYRKSFGILEAARQRMQSVLLQVPQEALREEDRALLLIGMAIAEDYLGLIDRKRSRLLPDRRKALEARALAHFHACKRLAEEAQAALSGLGGDTDDLATAAMARDLIQYHTWMLISQANIARTLDREEAIPAYEEVVRLLKDTVEQDRMRAAGGGLEPTTYDDYLIAHYPQLWLHASEWLKAVLHCPGDAEAPAPWDRIDATDRELVEEALQVCLTAFDAYTRLAARPNTRYPAAYEARIIYHASRAMSRGVLTDAEREAAKREALRAYRELGEQAKRHPDIRTEWVRNVEARVAELEGRW
jgi:hypothetical protein